ncbi:MAG: MATE family efflux transporter [Eubacteriales bacterium]|nr:MATE family efflux transporter [Eubacteriales bacterium]
MENKIFKKDFCGKHTFLLTVLRIAVPVALQSMLQSSFSMIDQLMVGQLGSTAVAAVEVAGRPSFIYSVIVGAMASIAGIMIAQYLGMEDRDAADRSLSVNLASAIGLALLFAAVCLIFSEAIVRIYTEDERIIKTGTEYLKIIAWMYVPMGAASILSVMVRCMDRASYPLYAGIISAMTNTLMNYVLIFGKCGFPELGVTGAAIASVISQMINLIIIILMFRRTERQKGNGFHFSLNLGKTGYLQYFAMLMPVVVNEFLWSVGQNVNTFIYGHIGTQQLAAMSLTGPVQGLFIGALSGISQAAGILIGKRLGAKEYDNAYGEAIQLVWYGFAGSLILSGFLLLLQKPYTYLYNVEPQVRITAGRLLTAFAVLAPVKVANMILGGGIIRSGGKTAYLMVIDMIGTWLVGAPLGLITAFVFHMPIVWVYFILSQEEVVRLVITFIVFRRKKWMSSLS